MIGRLPGKLNGPETYVTRTEWKGNQCREVTRRRSDGTIVKATKWRYA